jgi:hypothetical protein
MNINLVGGIAAVAVLSVVLYFGHKPLAPEIVKEHAPQESTTPVYHRVEPNGSKGPAIECKSVKLYAEGKSEAEVQAIAKQYGATIAVVKTWYVCIN